MSRPEQGDDSRIKVTRESKVVNNEPHRGTCRRAATPFILTFGCVSLLLPFAEFCEMESVEQMISKEKNKKV